MTSQGPPRMIAGSPGRRIRVILGKTGSDYLLVTNEDDGNREWQTTDWYNIPDGLSRQIYSCENKGRYITGVDFHAETGAWYVAGKKRDGSGAHEWWGQLSNDAVDAIKAASVKKVCLGSKNERNYGKPNEMYVVLDGRNGFERSYNIPNGLYQRLQRINRDNKEIQYLRLFHDGAYFISDEEGTEWCGLHEYLAKELMKNGVDLDVALAKDGSWVILRENSFQSSNGISSELTRKLSTFYSQQKERMESRQREINAYHALETERRALEAAQRERIEREAREELERLAREAAAREEAEREAAERERAQAEACEQARAEERLRLDLEEQRICAELKVGCREILTLDNIIERRKRELEASLESLPPARRARVEVTSGWCDISSSNAATTRARSECVICHDGEAERALVPCGHHCLCDGCAAQLMRSTRACPLCRELVMSTLKIYTHT